MSRLPMLLESTGSLPPTFLNASRCRPFNETTIDLPFAHRTFVPRHYESGYDYPLVVWLHSSSSSEMELDNVMSALSTQNYIAIAPRANVTCRGTANRFRWGASSTDCAVAEDLVWDCINAASSNLSVNIDKVFLAGFGAGGTMAQWIGLKYTSQIAGVVSLSAPFPKTPRVLSNWKRARSLPVLFAQQQGSTLCSDEEMVRAIRTSHQSGLDYKFWQLRADYENLGDEDGLDSTMLDAANRFMMSIVTDSQLNLSPESTSDIECVQFGFN
jgi:phospholipase/carboxylesterase